MHTMFIVEYIDVDNVDDLQDGMKINLEILLSSFLGNALLKCHLKCIETRWMYMVDSAKTVPRWLSVEERQDLRRDMAESSAWARAELKRRREEKAKQNAEHGTNNGTTTELSPKQL